MAKLKLEDIREDFLNEGWQLLSTVYVNLDGELEAKCPEGHLNYISYKKWRTRRVCATCLENNVIHIAKTNIPPKEPGVIRVLALDAATKDTGWAIFDDKILVDFGVFRVDGDDSVARIATVRQWLLGVIEAWEPDKIGSEDIQLQSFYNTRTRSQTQNVTLYKTLAHLQGVVMVTLYEKKVEHFVVHVSTWRSYCGITAKKRDDQKRAAQMKVSEWYGVQVNNDVAEAICLGKYLAEKHIKNNSMMSWE